MGSPKVTPVLVGLRERLPADSDPILTYDDGSSLNYVGPRRAGGMLAVTAPFAENFMKTLVKDVRGGGED